MYILYLLKLEGSILIIRFYPNEKGKRKERFFLPTYSVLNECPQEQLFVTLGLLILKPEPIRLST